MNSSSFFCEKGLVANYVSSLRAPVAFYDIKGNFFAFVEGLKACALNSGEMDEYVVTVVALDETITLFCVEPFYFASHLMAS
jgi:hypothetical protein